MKKHYKHLNQNQRDRIQAMLDAGHKQKEIAGVLKVDNSTISREIKRNRRKIRRKGGTIDGKYESSVAHHKAYRRRYHAKFRRKKIHQDKDLRTYIIERLKQGWSPQEISGRMIKERRKFYASKTAIYDWLYYSYQGQEYSHYLYSKRKRPKRRKELKPKKTLIPHRKGIECRPKGSTNRSRYGHYEGDTVVSGRKTGSKASLSVVYDRKAKYVDARRIPNLKPASNNRAIKNIEKIVRIKSLSLDNGIENVKHEKLGIPTFFCDPYSSWQKGGVENAIKMIRRYVPKGCDIGDYSPKYIKKIVHILNNKPRKSLDYRTPLEIMTQHRLLKN